MSREECQWVDHQDATPHMGSKRRQILFCKCQLCKAARAAETTGEPVQAPAIEERREVLRSAAS